MNNTMMVTVRASGAAFEADDDGGHREMARVLRRIADEVESGWVQGPARDSNGNTVGEYSW